MRTRENYTVGDLYYWHRLDEVSLNPAARSIVKFLCDGDIYLKDRRVYTFNSSS